MSVELPHLPKVHRKVYNTRVVRKYPPDPSLPLLERAATIAEFGRCVQRPPSTDAEVILTMVTAWLAEHGHHAASEFMLVEVLGMVMDSEGAN